MFSDPKKNLEQFDISPGLKVADFGAGVGYYTFPISHAVGPTGIVVALDVQKDLLLTIKQEANKTGLFNIETLWVDLETPHGSKLKENSMDRAVVANCLFHIKNKEDFAHEVSRVVKPGGLVLVIDWADTFGGIGPNKNDVVPKSVCRELFMGSGFLLEKEIKAGLHHYGFVFKKA